MVCGMPGGHVTPRNWTELNVNALAAVTPLAVEYAFQNAKLLITLVEVVCDKYTRVSGNYRPSFYVHCLALIKNAFRFRGIVIFSPVNNIG